MRLFAAIDIPDSVKDELRTTLGRLKPLAKIQWSPVDNMHITTKFIGEWPEERLEEIKGALALMPARGPIDIQVGGVGWFPTARQPRVFWVGVEGGEPLRELAEATERAVGKLGVPEEHRPYSPHLTLARIRDRVPLDALRKAAEALETRIFGAFGVQTFYLYLSAGGKYTKLATFPIH
jgi:RNA 2',3'-cyclic 3'-phosphodiesterase